ncbi:copper chaperone PCu(A)C [Streptomyces violascens]|uniref:copper chaperone PCu(A)C n=1 Tax=Streptomyces violascens TaxID=67381 RepID=UPI00379DED90
MTGIPRRPTRRRLSDTLLAVFASVAACGIALGGLCTWTAHGNAGSPARITVAEGRLFLPYGDTSKTAAFFRITNSGGSGDRLLKVTSPDVGGTAVLSRHRMGAANSASARPVASVSVPSGGSIAMSPSGVDVVVPAKGEWRTGDLVAFTLHFERSGAVRNLAVVVRPGQGGT